MQSDNPIIGTPVASDRRPDICLVYRKPSPLFFSIEKIFLQLTGVMSSGSFNIRPVYAPHYSASLLKIFENLLQLRRIKADIYHITGDVHYAVLAFPSKNTVLTIHDCNFLHNYHGIKKWVLSFLFLKWPVYRSRFVTTISEKSRQEIIEHTNCDPDKVIVIPNPVSGHIFFQPRTFDEQKPTLLFIGSTPNKNLNRVAEALRGVPCILRIIGKLPQTMYRALEERGIAYSVCSGLTEKELAEEYAAADIILFPSLYEGFGLPIIEGQKAGRPVITSNISPMKEVAGEGACLVDPYDPSAIREAVTTVIHDKEYRERLVRRGFENVNRFSVDVVAEQYCRLYASVMNSVNDQGGTY